MKHIHSIILTLCLAAQTGVAAGSSYLRVSPLTEKAFIFPDVQAADTLAQISAKQMLAFMKEEIVCSNYVFTPGEFPVFYWRNESLAENLAGPGPITVKFYDADFNEVTSAALPGRYGAVAECTTRDGFRLRRYITLFCTQAEFDDYSPNVPIRINNLSQYGIPAEKWSAYEKNLERFSFGSLKMFPVNNPEAAVFLAGLSGMDSADSMYDSPRLNDRRWWAKLKNKLSAFPVQKNPLLLPLGFEKKSSSDVAGDLKGFSEVNASSYDKAKLAKLRQLCSEWADKEKTANVTTLIHKGRIIFNEAFGSDEKGSPLTVNSKMWMASITKMLTGALLMQFSAQGLIDLDAPVSRYLPELPENLKGLSPETLPVRQLLNHTSGLHIAGEWASDWNYSLENQVAQLLPYLDTGKEFSYHRGGYALAGKLMERLTGCILPDLFRDYIFKPLKMYSAYSDNSYGGLYCTTEDLASFGQMLLQKGSFNGVQLFPEHTFIRMLPSEIPSAGRKWGIGISPFTGQGLSSSAFGHGAASGTVFRIDPANQLIIISARNTPGKNYKEYEKRLIECCTSLIN